VLRDVEKRALARCTCGFIKELCMKLGLQLLSQCTAMVFFHRFFKHQSFEQHDRFVVGTACVFLAAKVEEDMRRLDEVSKQAQSIRNFGKMSDLAAGEPTQDLIRMIREKVLLCERVLLNTLSFDVSVTHPHIPAFNLIKKIRVQGGPKGLNEFRQASWNFLNDSLFTDICVKFNPEEIAAASVLLAYYFMKARVEHVSDTTKRIIQAVERELADRSSCIFDYKRAHLEAIIHEMMDVYEAPRPFTQSHITLEDEPVEKKMKV